MGCEKHSDVQHVGQLGNHAPGWKHMEHQGGHNGNTEEQTWRWQIGLIDTLLLSKASRIML